MTIVSSLCLNFFHLQNVLALKPNLEIFSIYSGRWFSPGTPASSTTKTGHHDIVEILLKVVLSTKKSIKQSIYRYLKKKMSINFTSPNPVLLVPGFGKVA